MLVVYFTSQLAASKPIPSVSVNGTLVIPVNSARSLGVVLDTMYASRRP